ncbi:hypothetical protein CLV51_1011052 [Chitinophaga niastensis]|uniref:Lipoprotein n=1 Tax=Chitinophaga niastensis TaxID=536980 RepID=A0A2P8HU11_CHINA|nr:hypothetical protein [Chitinophaga niastensis]PSL49717.1 hypothetical protein CLV51_1011052 [Chitinophaga niastensis]
MKIQFLACCCFILFSCNNKQVITRTEISKKSDVHNPIKLISSGRLEINREYSNKYYYDTYEDSLNIYCYFEKQITHHKKLEMLDSLIISKKELLPDKEFSDMGEYENNGILYGNLPLIYKKSDHDTGTFRKTVIKGWYYNLRQ